MDTLLVESSFWGHGDGFGEDPFEPDQIGPVEPPALGDPFSLHIRRASDDLGRPHQHLIGVAPPKRTGAAVHLAFENGDPEVIFLTPSGHHAARRAGAVMITSYWWAMGTTT